MVGGRRNRRLRRQPPWLLVALAIVGAGSGTASAQPALDSPAADAIRQQLIERAQRQWSGAADAPAGAAREELLALGEQALRAGDAGAATALFERAGFVKHAADAEMGLVRSYLQAGEYQRALGFAAHTAGAHPDVTVGLALYVWLLHLGGQERAAGVLLERAGARRPEDPVLMAAAALLGASQATPSAMLLEPPGRLAPFSPESARLPSTTRVTGSGVLIGASDRAVTSLAAVEEAACTWVRDGLGRVAAARVTRSVPELGIAELRLESPLGTGAAPWPATRDAFPGSPAYAIHFPAPEASLPSWPRLQTGFLGAPTAVAGIYRAGVGIAPGPRGGPMFDGSGRLIGIVVATAAGDAMVSASQLRRVLGLSASADVGSDSPRMAVDAIYERALHAAVQVITGRQASPPKPPCRGAAASQ
jgi:S1-C subfamily serine protease